MKKFKKNAAILILASMACFLMSVASFHVGERVGYLTANKEYSKAYVPPESIFVAKAPNYHLQSKNMY